MQRLKMISLVTLTSYLKTQKGRLGMWLWSTWKNSRLVILRSKRAMWNSTSTKDTGKRVRVRERQVCILLISHSPLSKKKKKNHTIFSNCIQRHQTILGNALTSVGMIYCGTTLTYAPPKKSHHLCTLMTCGLFLERIWSNISFSSEV